MLDQTRMNNKANEILSTTEAEGQTQWVTPEYDARGNMITMPKPDSPASAFTCTWDAWDRLVQVKDSDTDQIIATYRYDGTRRRIAKLLGANPVNPDVTFDYYYSVRQVVEIRKDGSEHPYKQYVWGLRYVHSPVLRWRDENTDGQDVETLYYTNDANFNVTALVDTSGNVVERYTYEPYGKVTFRAADWTVRQSSAYGNEILYTGHRLDTETGLYYGGWRYYHPTLGCWITRDPSGYQDGVHLYQYVGSRPLIGNDANGLSWAGTQGDAGWYGPAFPGSVDPHSGKTYCTIDSDCPAGQVCRDGCCVVTKDCPEGSWSVSASLSGTLGLYAGWVWVMGRAECDSSEAEAVIAIQGEVTGLQAGASIEGFGIHGSLTGAYYETDLNSPCRLHLFGVSAFGASLSLLVVEMQSGGEYWFLSFGAGAGIPLTATHTPEPSRQGGRTPEHRMAKCVGAILPR